jgi:hypothetical protein
MRNNPMGELAAGLTTDTNRLIRALDLAVFKCMNWGRHGTAKFRSTGVTKHNAGVLAVGNLDSRFVVTQALNRHDFRQMSHVA